MQPSAGGSDAGSPDAGPADAGSLDAGELQEGGTSSDAATDFPLPLWDAGDAGDAGDAEAPGDAAADAGDASPPDSGEPPIEPPVDWTASVACSWGPLGDYSYGMTLSLENTTAAALDLTDVQVRYYFSANTATAPGVTLYFSPVNSAAATVQPLGAAAVAGADRFVNVDYVGCAGATCTLAQGATSEIQFGITSATGGLNGADDYSYTPDDADPCEFVVVTSAGNVIFGTPPS